MLSPLLISRAWHSPTDEVVPILDGALSSMQMSDCVKQWRKGRRRDEMRNVFGVMISEIPPPSQARVVVEAVEECGENVSRPLTLLSLAKRTRCA